MSFYKTGPTLLHLAALSGKTYISLVRYLKERNIDPVLGSPKKNRRYPVEECRKMLEDVFARKNKVNKTVHCFYNFKGGVGKTSLSFQVATHLSLLGYKILLLDSDPQANLTNCFGLQPNLNVPTLYDILIKGVPINTATLSIFEGLDFVQSNISLTRLETELMHQTRKEELLKDVLDSVRDKYDFIIIDANPNINQINRNVINASDVINIVCETQPFSIMGLSLLYNDMVTFFNKMKKTLPILNVIPNKYEDRVSTSAEAMHTLRENFSAYMAPDFAVRKSEDFNVSVKSALPLSFFCRQTSNAWEDTVEVVRHLVEISKPIEKTLKVA